jgi:hypothetical protein
VDERLVCVAHYHTDKVVEEIVSSCGREGREGLQQDVEWLQSLSLEEK